MQALEFLDELTTKLRFIREELNMETAIVSYINEGSYTLIVVDTEMQDVFKAGMIFPLEDTYCHDVYKFNRVMRYRHVGSMDNMLQHPVYQSVKLECYIAAPINDHKNNVFGTVNFTSLFTKTTPFTEYQIDLVTELGNYIEHNIEQYKSLVNDTLAKINA